MRKIVMMVSVTLFSWLGWWLGEDIGLMTAFMLSSVASLFGVVVGWWVNTNWLADF